MHLLILFASLFQVSLRRKHHRFVTNANTELLLVGERVKTQLNLIISNFFDYMMLSDIVS